MHNGGNREKRYKLNKGIIMNNFKKNIYKIYNIPDIPTIACSAGASSGGVGVSEFVIPLDKPLGGIVIMDFNAAGVVDKLEIIHN